MKLLRGNNLGIVAAGLLLLFLVFPKGELKAPEVVQSEEPPSTGAVVREYLESKGSPLAEHTEVLLQQKNWKLLIAISRIESQFCKIKISYNCWGIGGDARYRHYEGYEDAIIDAEKVIEYWQERGRWLTVEDMNCHYVVPCNENWVRVVSSTLIEIDKLTENARR